MTSDHNITLVRAKSLSATTTASLPSSQSTGSLQNLLTSAAATATTSSPSSSPSRPLVNRQSNPIISTEDDDDEDDDYKYNNDGNNNESSEGRLRVSGNDAEFLAAAAALAASAEAQTTPAPDETIQISKATAKEAVFDSRGNINNEAVNFDAAMSSVEMSLSNLADDDSTHKPTYIPATLLPSNTSTSSPTTTIANSGSNHDSSSSFDFDATRHSRLKGTGYLASEISLATPTDVFAAGCTLLQLCAIGNLPSVKDYVSSVFKNVNFRDYDRRTALHVAASEGHLDVVKYLVTKGANVNRSDRWGGSSLDDAHRHRHTDVARYLRSKGAKTGS